MTGVSLSVPPPHDPRHGPGWGQGTVPPGLTLASGGVRFAARTIDYIFLGLGAGGLSFLLIVIALVATDADNFGTAEDGLYNFLFVFSWGVWLLLYDWLFLMAGGATPGKMLCGIKVVGSNGERLSQGQGLGRAALFGLPQSLICIGHLFAVLESVVGFGTPTKQALHDKAAGTYVVKTR